MHFALWMRFAGYALLGSAAAYAILSVLAVRLRRRVDAAAAVPAPVTVLKPLCGDEPRLYENLRSFCIQDYPQRQLLFGIRDASDPARQVALRLQHEFPRCDIGVIVDPQVHGINLKVSNLLNLVPHARHQWLVLADSDIAVTADYLRRVTAPLAQADVGIVTCLYRGRATGGFWSRVGVQFIDDWFLPSVCLARLFGSTAYAFGSTIALRRDTLDAIGGFQALSNRVADDYLLGQYTRELGLRTVLSDYQVITDVVENRFADLAAHELRWLRTIRSMRPLGYLFTGICFTLPATLAGLILAGGGTVAGGLAVAAVGARLLLFAAGESQRIDARGAADRGKDLLAFLVRDTLSLALWLVGLLGDKVRWRDQQMKIDRLAASTAPAARAGDGTAHA